MKIVKYESRYRLLWDEFIANSKNGTFLFYRDYMEYHIERFHDYSLLFFNDSNQLIAVMPANAVENRLVTHGGLTFGGVISDKNMKTATMLQIFESLCEHLLLASIHSVTYKAIPHIYHRLPAEEDLYALFRFKAKLYRRDASSTLLLSDQVNYSKGRKHSLKKGKLNGLEVKQSNDFETFMQIDEQHLMQKYGKKPVHTATEMQILAKRFPENIKLFASFISSKMLAGVVIYESQQVAHAQYIATTDEGKDIGALDVIIDFLIRNFYKEKKYFDFGISTEENGTYLNSGLIANKEGFGARTTVYDFYEMNLVSS